LFSFSCLIFQRTAPVLGYLNGTGPEQIRLAQSASVGINVLNPIVYLEVALLECVIVLVACIGPALRAARVDPLSALRSD